MNCVSIADLAKSDIKLSELRFAASDPEGNNVFTDLITDSRSLCEPAATIFAALRTGVNDGHRYIPALYSKGVRAFIVEEIPDDCRGLDAAFVVVASVEEALRDIARLRLEALHGGIVVTGSIGKTKTKELIYRGLLSKGDARRSPRSWNSGIGIPLAVWDMTKPDGTPDFFITEAAIDGPGQARKIRSVLDGSYGIGVVTPITTEHDEAFPSHAAKVREKVEVVAGCHTIVYADSDDELRRQLEALTDVRLVPVAIGNDKQGVHSVFHALADAVLAELGFDAQEAYSLPISDTRRDISHGCFGNVVVRDRFTYDLRSLEDTLDFFRRHCNQECDKILVLGDILHGPLADEALAALYARALELARLAGIGKVLAVGDDMRKVAFSFEGLGFVEMATDSPRYTSAIESGDLWRDSRILLFGNQDGDIAPYSRALESADHDTTLEVDLDALVHNYNYYRRLLPPRTGMVAMVKASAYGMGAEEIGRALQSQGAAYLAVAVVDEAVALRDAGITMPVMVLNPITNRYHTLFSYNLEPAIFSPEELNRMLAEAKTEGVSGFPIHIKIYTGMHRVGFLENQIDYIAEVLQGQENVRVASVFTHLATADCLDMDEYTAGQIEAFQRIAGKLAYRLGYNPKRHYLNTAGMMRFADSGDYDMARLGIGLYGISPYAGPEAAFLKPVAAFRSRIISLKHWPAGTPIGYGCKGRTERDSIIATVPVGYADGVNRHLGNGGAGFVVRGVECPTIGNICMDLCMVDVTDAQGVSVGDSVEIFGSQMPVERLAERLGTIPYEILTSVSPRVRRTYFYV